MSEIEKMYENAGIKSKKNYYCPECESLLEDWYSGDDYIEYRCTDCEYAVDNRMEELNTLKFTNIYPPFTAEKQLNIVKFLLNKSVYYDTYGDREYWFHISDEIENSKYREFDEAIAECINKMWEDLRDYEKVQIKEILE